MMNVHEETFPDLKILLFKLFISNVCPSHFLMRPSLLECKNQSLSVLMLLDYL